MTNAHGRYISAMLVGQRLRRRQSFGQLHESGKGIEKITYDPKKRSIHCQQHSDQADRKDTRHDGTGHLQAAQEGFPDAFRQAAALFRSGKSRIQRRMYSAFRDRTLGLRLHAFPVFIRKAVQRIHPHRDRRNNKRDEQRGPEVEIPSVHQSQSACHCDHKSGRHGGKAGRNDSRFLFCVGALRVKLIGDEKRDGVAADKRGYRVDG